MVTSGSIASNPRLLKEARAFSKTGYRVSIVFLRSFPPLIPFEDAIIWGEPQWQVSFYDATKTPNLMTHKLKSKIASMLFPLAPLLSLARIIKNRHWRDQLILAVKTRADLYIAHNLGALPVAALAAKKVQAPYAFDAEDYHRGESKIWTSNKAAEMVEERYFLGAVYNTVASPLIGEAYQKSFPGLSFTVVNNVFSLEQQPAFRHANSNAPLKLFWFSQTVGLNRGIQDVLNAMVLLPDIAQELTLVGTCQELVKQHLKGMIQSAKHNIRFAGTLTEDELIQLASKHDIGLALERKEPENRDICLTNKIFTYLLAGNALVASNTSAQTLFLKEHPEVGFVYEIGQIEKLASQLRYWHQNRDVLETTRLASWTLANQKLNWEEESKKFVSLIDGILNNQ